MSPAARHRRTAIRASAASRSCAVAAYLAHASGSTSTPALTPPLPASMSAGVPAAVVDLAAALARRAETRLPRAALAVAG